MMPRLPLKRAIFLLAALFVAGCQAAPVTGRQQFILLSDSEANQLGLQAYQQIKQESRISRNNRMNQTVRRVGSRIARASGANFNWEFTVFENDEPNAFALPGGKVGVNSGLFKVAKNEAQLAAVMGHEVAHAVARHSAERVSQQMVIQGGLQALNQGGGAQMAQIAAAAATLGVVLPFSRNQESEADEIGLLYMARAGYDPREAVNLWRNFAAYGGSRGPSFLSTHPSPGDRIQRLQAQMPRALSIYKNNRRG